MKKHFITYGTNRYSHSKFRLAKQVESLQIFDSVDVCDEKNISLGFKEKHKEVLNKAHGGGFWIWKYYIILRTLETMEDGDIVLYLDSGSTLNNGGKKRLQEYFELLLPF